MNDYDVTLRLELEAPSEPIEDLAIRALEAVERHGSGIALGPVVGGTLEPPAVELDFGVVAASSADAHELVARLIGMIERHANIGAIRGASVIEREPIGS